MQTDAHGCAHGNACAPRISVIRSFASVFKNVHPSTCAVSVADTCGHNVRSAPHVSTNTCQEPDSMPRLTLTDRFVAGAKPRDGIGADYADTVAVGLTLRVSDGGAKSWSFRFRVPGGGGTN